jgi:hypothetical protein
MAVLGLRGTGDWGADERPKDFRSTILFRDPNGSAPLTALMSKMRKQVTTDPEFSWWEEELSPVRLQVNGALASGATTVVIDDGDAGNLIAGDLLMVEKAATTGYTYELIEVVSVSSATTFVVTRGAAGTTAAAIPDNAFLLKISNVHAEGTGSPNSSTRNPTKYSNFTSIKKTTYTLTGTAEQTSTRTGDPVQNDKKRKMFDHAVACEYDYLFGTPFETVGANGKPKRFTGGLLHYLSLAHSAATPTVGIIPTATADGDGEDLFLNATYQMWDYSYPGSGNMRLMLAGNGFMNRLNKWARASPSSRINHSGSLDVYKMNLQRWELPQGDMLVRTHPLMNLNSRYTNSAFIIDPTGMVYRPLKNRDTKFKDNIQLPDEDLRKGQWMTEAGVEFHHLRAMRYIAIQ